MSLQYGGSGLVLYLLLRFLPKREVWNALRQLPLRLWIFVLVGYLAAHLIGAAKYRLVLNLGGAELDVKQAARCYFAGLFGSLFLPLVSEFWRPESPRVRSCCFRFAGSHFACDESSYNCCAPGKGYCVSHEPCYGP